MLFTIGPLLQAEEDSFFGAIPTAIHHDLMSNDGNATKSLGKELGPHLEKIFAIMRLSQLGTKVKPKGESKTL